jgi:phage protein D
MFNYIKINFPEVAPDRQPSFVNSVSVYQDRYSHELVEIKFRDWDISYDVVSPGSPVSMTMYGPAKSKDFYGYVHHIKVEKTPGKDFVTLLLIGASFVMKKTEQKVFTNVTADQIVKEIAAKHNFVCYAVPHPRVYPQVAQTGHSDWELMVRLAKQSGYTLRTTNTELYFQPMLEDYTRYRSEAPKFTMRPVGHPDGSTLYSFTPVIGENIAYEDSKKAAVSISGVDKVSENPISFTQQKANKKTRQRQYGEFFDKFDSYVVAPNADVVKYEAESAERRNAFPYRAKIEVLGDPTVRPDLPIYLEGIGDVYSGFWTVLDVEHRIVEEELNRHRYTIIMTVGTDSLGSALTWEDNKTITEPDYVPKRTVLPNVKQTKVVPQTELIRTTRKETPQVKPTFGKTENRTQPNLTNRENNPALWQSKTRSLNEVIDTKRRSKSIAFLLAKKEGIL